MPPAFVLSQDQTLMFNPIYSLKSTVFSLSSSFVNEQMSFCVFFTRHLFTTYSFLSLYSFLEPYKRFLRYLSAFLPGFLSSPSLMSFILSPISSLVNIFFSLSLPFFSLFFTTHWISLCFSLNFFQ